MVSRNSAHFRGQCCPANVLELISVNLEREAQRFRGAKSYLRKVEADA